MSTVEERLTSLEAKVDWIADLRVDMTRQFGYLREEITRLRDETSRGFERLEQRIDRLDQRGERQFMWMVGIQFAVFISVIAALMRVALL